MRFLRKKIKDKRIQDLPVFLLDHWYQFNSLFLSSNKFFWKGNFGKKNLLDPKNFSASRPRERSIFFSSEKLNKIIILISNLIGIITCIHQYLYVCLFIYIQNNSLLKANKQKYHLNLFINQ